MRRMAIEIVTAGCSITPPFTSTNRTDYPMRLWLMLRTFGILIKAALKPTRSPFGLGCRLTASERAGMAPARMAIRRSDRPSTRIARPAAGRRRPQARLSPGNARSRGNLERPKRPERNPAVSSSAQAVSWASWRGPERGRIAPPATGGGARARGHIAPSMRTIASSTRCGPGGRSTRGGRSTQRAAVGFPCPPNASPGPPAS